MTAGGLDVEFTQQPGRNRVPSINLTAEDNSGSQPSKEPNRLVDQCSAA
jgi:hypothetical protein